MRSTTEQAEISRTLNRFARAQKMADVLMQGGLVANEVAKSDNQLWDSLDEYFDKVSSPATRLLTIALMRDREEQKR